MTYDIIIAVLKLSSEKEQGCHVENKNCTATLTEEHRKRL